MANREPITISARNFNELPHTLVLREVCLLCNISGVGALYWVTTGKLPARHVGRVWLIEKTALLAYARKRGIILSYAKTEQAI